MRAAIVQAVCRATGARDRGFAAEEGNIVDVLVSEGMAPDVVIDACAKVSGIPLADPRLLARAQRWPAVFDFERCRRQGMAPIGYRQERWVVAFTDPERAASSASLGLPAHTACLALSHELLPFYEAWEPPEASTPSPPSAPGAPTADPDPFAPRETLVSVSTGDGTEEEALFDDSVEVSPALARLASADADATFTDDAPEVRAPAGRRSSPPSPLPSPPARRPKPSTPAPAPAASRPPRSAPTASGDDHNDDDDLDLFVDKSEQIERPEIAGEGSAPRARAGARLDDASPVGRHSTTSTSAPRPPPSVGARQSTVSTSAARRRPSSQSDGTVSTVSTSAARPPETPASVRPVRPARRRPAEAVDRGPARPPTPLRFPRRALAAGAVLVCAALGAWLLVVSRPPAPPAPPSTRVEGGKLLVNAGQAELVRSAASTTDDETAVKILTHAYKLDPDTIEGGQALLARAQRLLALGRRKQADRDLELLLRRDDVEALGEPLVRFRTLMRGN